MVLDLHAAGKRRVDRAVAVARPVDRPLDQLLVGLALPTAVEGQLDLVEGLRPFVVPFAFLGVSSSEQRSDERLIELADVQTIPSLQIGASTDGITFVAADFTEPGLADALAGAGYDATKPSLFAARSWSERRAHSSGDRSSARRT